MKELKPVYYIYGSEEYLVEEALKEICSKALEGGLADLNYHVFEAKSLDPSEVVTVALTVPAMSPKRVVVVKEAQSLKSIQEKALLEYVKDPSPSTVLVFVALTSKIDKRLSLIKFLIEKGFTSSYNRLSDTRLLGWIKAESRRQGKTITEHAARRLINTAGTALRDLKGELDKIVIFTGTKKTIDISDVEDCGLDLKEETIFSLSEAIGGKDVRKAIKILSKVSSEPMPTVLGAISRQMRTLLKLKVLLRKGLSTKQLPALVGVPPYYLDGYVKRAGYFTEAELRDVFKKLYGADRDLKTGRFPRDLVLSKLILELCR